MADTMDLIKQRYDELCAKRDARNARVAPLREQLAAANAEVEAAREKALTIKARIDAELGGADWISIKKEIGRLAHVVNVAKPAAPAPAAEAAEQ